MKRGLGIAFSVHRHSCPKNPWLRSVAAEDEIERILRTSAVDTRWIGMLRGEAVTDPFARRSMTD